MFEIDCKENFKRCNSTFKSIDDFKSKSSQSSQNNTNDPLMRRAPINTYNYNWKRLTSVLEKQQNGFNKQKMEQKIF